MSMYDKMPEWEYAAYKPCGCLVGVCVDMGDKDTARALYDWIRAGCRIERFHRSRIKEVLADGIGCKCKPDKQQPELF